MAFAFPQSITAKVLGIGVLALLMLIPLDQVRSLIGERSGLSNEAANKIAQGWGGPQRLGGPVMLIPRRIRVDTDKGVVIRDDGHDVVLPDRLQIAAVMDTNVRRYGIYDTPVYTAKLKISGEFRAADFKQLKDADSWLWDQAELRVPISDVRGIREVSALQFNGDELRLGPGESVIGNLGAISVPVDLSHVVDARAAGDKLAFALDMTLGGTQSISFMPLARTTDVTLTSSWPDPSFDGAFLPAEHGAGNGKPFDARWQVLDLNRGFGQHWHERTQNANEIAAASFGMKLYQPVSVYQNNERAGKYGVLFIAMTFVAFFLFEVLKKLRVHPVQYLMIGVALATFYVVLLAFSEHIGFAWAYLVAATSVVLIIGGFAAAVLRARRAGVMLAATLACVYGLLYGLVASEQYSLLMGAIALLGAVAALMYLTRKVDWYSYAAAAPRPIAAT